MSSNVSDVNPKVLKLSSEVSECKPLIAAISTEATQESALEELLNKVTTKWGDVEFQCVSYKESKDTFILGGIEAGAYTPPLFGST